MPEAPKAEEGELPSTEDGEGDAKEGDAKEGENVAEDENAAGTADNSTESAAVAEAKKAAEAAAAKKAEEESKPRPVKITLDITTATKDLPDMDEDTVSASRERLRTLLVRWKSSNASLGEGHSRPGALGFGFWRAVAVGAPVLF